VPLLTPPGDGPARERHNGSAHGQDGLTVTNSFLRGRDTWGLTWPTKVQRQSQSMPDFPFDRGAAGLLLRAA
jgi:hypothetical protein